jgi:hypothetical protein
MFLVHDKFKDVFIEVVRTNEAGDRTQIRWWNVGCPGGRQWVLPVKKTRDYYQFDQWVETKKLIGMREFDPDKPETHPGRKNV